MLNFEANILVADDIAGMRLFVIKKFKALGFKNFIQAENGKQAFELITDESNNISLMASDHNMPEMTGIECLKALRQTEKYKDFPVLLITAEGEHKTRAEAIESGVTAYLTKPFKDDELLKVLNAIPALNDKTPSQDSSGEKTSTSSPHPQEEKKAIVFKDLLKSIFLSVHDGFQGQCDLKLNQQKSRIIPPGENWQQQGETLIASTAQLTSPSLQCSMVFCFELKAFLKYVGAMFGEEVLEMNDENKDLVSEWLNIALGKVKVILNDEMGSDFVNTIPMTVIGNNLVIPAPEKTPLIVVPFQSDIGGFEMILSQSPEPMVPWDNSFLANI